MLHGLSNSESVNNLKVSKTVYSRFGKDSGIFNYIKSPEKLILSKIVGNKTHESLNYVGKNKFKNKVKVEEVVLNQLLDNIVNYQDKNYYSLIRFLRNRGNQLNYLPNVDTLTGKFPEVIIPQTQNYIQNDLIGLINYNELLTDDFLNKQNTIKKYRYLPKLQLEKSIETKESTPESLLSVKLITNQGKDLNKYTKI
jgi:hypothetical protein